MKRHFTCTLTDLSPRMLAVSRSINPECEHIQGDMRELRLGRQFDAVFVHDAVEYMTSLDDLSRAVQTAYVHTRPAASRCSCPTAPARRSSPMPTMAATTARMAARCATWNGPSRPNPGETFYEVHFACLLREGDDVRVVHDCHRHALFTRQQWEDVLESAGFELTTPAARSDAGCVPARAVESARRRAGSFLAQTRTGEVTNPN